MLASQMVRVTFGALQHILKSSVQTVLHIDLLVNIAVTVHAQLCLNAGQRLVAETALPLKIRMGAVPCQHDIRIAASAQSTRAECQPALAPDRQPECR